ncbi:MAG: thiosulfate oxidation carrier protein SoxY [Rhodospirillaceae bacterium]
MTDKTLRRRDFLAIAGAGALGFTMLPLPAAATPADVMAVIGKAIGGKAPKEGRIEITLPEIAENGGVVPLKVVVESPMSDADHVKRVHVFADGNPLPDVATYHFGPHNGKAEFSLRLRLAKSQKIVCVAEMSDGSVYMAGREIKVTLGGCGG